MLLVMALLAATVVMGSSGILARLLDVRVLLALTILNLALLGWRLVAIIQAHARRGA